MQSLNFLFEQIKKIAQILIDNPEIIKDKEGIETSALFGEAETKPKVDGFNNQNDGEYNLTDEDLEKYAEWKEATDMKDELINSVTGMLAEGVITEELADKVTAALTGKFNKETITELFEAIQAEANAETSEAQVITDAEEINNYLNSLTLTAKNNIVEQAGGIEEIVSVSDYGNGTFKINTKKENSAITVLPSGKYIQSYADEKQTGFDTFDEQGRVVSSSYIDHTRNDAVINETTTYNNDDGSSQKVISNTNEPNVLHVVDTSAENEITTIRSENTETGEINVQYAKDGNYDASTYPSVVSGGSLEDLESANSELKALESEKAQVEEDLSEQQDSYDQTTSEKDAALSDIDSEISTGEGECQQAQDDLADANEACSAAQSEADSAAEDAAQKGECTDSAKSDLEDAQSDTEEAKGCADSAQANNQACQQAESSARRDSNSANNDLADATTETGAARATQAGTAADYAQAAKETVAAFNVRNQKQAEVDKAQAEYDNAKSKEANGDESLWTKFKNWVSSAWNALSNAIAGRDKAQAEAEAKQREEEKAKVIDDEAKAELEKREQEQQNAQEIADAAQVILERKTGEREVSDQEYADALLDLADAFMVQNNAESEYDSALTAFMEAKNYKADADGNLVDAQGNVVECSQIAAELELFVQGLYANREDTEVSYNSTLETTAAVISGDEEQIAQLQIEIETLKVQIEEEKQMLMLQEQMLTSLAVEQGELDAKKDGAGITDDIAALWGGSYGEDADKLAENRELLEKAIMSGNKEDVIAAYKSIYGDKEVILDANGNIVTDTSALTEEELQNCTMASISDLSDENIGIYVENEGKSAATAKDTITAINGGLFTVDGQTVTMEDMNAALMAQANELIAEMENSINEQGWLSRGMSGLNDIFGFGTSESEAQAQVEYYKSMVEELENCSDPVQYAALYKELTGQNFDTDALASLLAYNKAAGITVEGKNAPKTSIYEEQCDLSDGIDQIVDAVNSNAGGDPSVLAVTDNSNANEQIQNYIDTQATMTDTATGVITGVITAAAVAAAPFTGGASLLLGAAVGAGTNLALNASNSIYDKDGDGSVDFNYSGKEALQDAALGAISGLTGTGANMIGGAVTAQLGKSAAQTAVATTFKEAAKQAAMKYGSQLAGAAVEGFIDGSASSGLNYTVMAATDENVDFSLETLAEVTLQGGGMGAVLNTGITGVGHTASGTKNAFDTSSFTKEINDALAGKTGNNALADMVASKLDDTLLDANGQVNKYAVSTLMNNAENSLTALTKAGFSSDDAMEFLKGTDLNMQGKLPTVVEQIQTSLKNLGGESVLGVKDIDKLLKNMDISSVKFDEAGNITAFSSKVGVDDTMVNFQLDKTSLTFDSSQINTNIIDKPKTTNSGKASSVIEYTPEMDRQLQELKRNGVISKDFELIKPKSTGGKIDAQLADDVSKLYTAFKNGDDITETFVKKFSSTEDAVAQLGVGDVYQIEGSSKMGIILADGTAQELNISAEKYMELFPPVERFSMNQQRIGDCYLVAGLDALNKTPETRVQLLQCFTEQADGSVSVKLPNGKIEFTIEDGVSISESVSDSFLKTSNGSSSIINQDGYLSLVNGPKGMQALEYTYGLELQQNMVDAAWQNLDRQINSMLDTYTGFESRIEFYSTILENPDSYSVDQLREMFKDVAQSGDTKFGDYYSEFFEQYFKNFVPLNADGTGIDTDAIAKKLQDQISAMTDLDAKALGLYEGIDDEISKIMTDIATNPESLRGRGGHTNNVFKMFGISDAQMEYSDITSILIDQENWGSRIFAGGTFGDSDTRFLNQELQIAGNHAYSINPFVDENGIMKFKVTNPWKTSESNIFTLEQIRQYFETIYYGTTV